MDTSLVAAMAVRKEDCWVVQLVDMLVDVLVV